MGIELSTVPISPPAIDRQRRGDELAEVLDLADAFPARGTADIDLNLFVDPDQLGRVLAALPPEVTVTDADRALSTRSLCSSSISAQTITGSCGCGRQLGTRPAELRWAGRRHLLPLTGAGRR